MAAHALILDDKKLPQGYRKLCNVSPFDPTFGIAHATREHSTPLAYDLMEPFRPCVDTRVAQWIQQNPREDESWPVDKAYKKWVTAFPAQPLLYQGREMETRRVIEAALRSFRKALATGETRAYKPWTQTTTKWAG